MYFCESLKLNPMSLKLLILAAVLVVFIFILMRAHRLLISFFVKMTYGKYHPYYVEFQKKIISQELINEVKKEISYGISEKDAIRLISKRFKVSKNELYDLFYKVKKN